MLGLKEFCGLIFIFGCFMALTTPKPLANNKRSGLLKLQKLAKELFETYKTETNVSEAYVMGMDMRIKKTLSGLPNCSKNTHTDLDYIAAFNTLFIEMANRPERWLKEPVETKLLTVIGQSVCLLNHTMSEVNNLNIVFTVLKTSDLKAVYYYSFESFKICMDQLSRTTA